MKLKKKSIKKIIQIKNSNQKIRSKINIRNK